MLSVFVCGISCSLRKSVSIYEDSLNMSILKSVSVKLFKISFKSFLNLPPIFLRISSLKSNKYTRVRFTTYLTNWNFHQFIILLLIRTTQCPHPFLSLSFVIIIINHYCCHYHCHHYCLYYRRFISTISFTNCRLYVSDIAKVSYTLTWWWPFDSDGISS